MNTPEHPAPDQARFDPRAQHVENVPLRRHLISHVETYDVTAQELRSIERESLHVGQDFQFASNTASIGVTLLVALILTKIDSPTLRASFVAITIGMGVLSLYFFIRFFRGLSGTRSTIQEIRERQVGPFGEEGHEIPPNELAQLPSEPEDPEEPIRPEPGRGS
jgi:hypothetical protein